MLRLGCLHLTKVEFPRCPNTLRVNLVLARTTHARRGSNAPPVLHVLPDFSQPPCMEVEAMYLVLANRVWKDDMRALLTLSCSAPHILETTMEGTRISKSPGEGNSQGIACPHWTLHEQYFFFLRIVKLNLPSQNFLLCGSWSGLDLLCLLSFPVSF